MTTFPETLTIPIDNSQLKLVSISKDGTSANYIYIQSETKKDTTVSLTLKQINNFLKP